MQCLYWTVSTLFSQQSLHLCSKANMAVSWHWQHMCHRSEKKNKSIFHLLSSLLLCSHVSEKHPFFEARNGKRERLKQSESKLACQKALNQYPGSLPTQPCGPLTLTPPRLYNHPCHSPRSSGCFPSSPFILSRTPACSRSCSFGPSYSPLLNLNFSLPAPSASRLLEREEAGFVRKDGQMYRQRKTGGEGKVVSHRVGMGPF